MTDKLISIKVALLGDSGVGKTCIINRYIKNEYNAHQTSTIGANYQQKTIIKNNIQYQLDIWDTAGQEKYRSLGKLFYKDAYIVIFVYDICIPKSFEDIKKIWYEDLKKLGEKYTVLAVVGNKHDLFENEKVEEKLAREYAKEINATFMLVSAQNGNNIENLFNTLVNTYLGQDFQPKIQEMIEEKNDIDSTKLGGSKDTQTHNNKNCNC